MKSNVFFKLVLALLLSVAPLAMGAFDPVNDDTDIFLANPNITSERPNVLIILDNTANWNTAFTNDKFTSDNVTDELRNRGLTGAVVSVPFAPRTMEQGADTAVWLATLPEDGPSGGFFLDRKAIPW